MRSPDYPTRPRRHILAQISRSNAARGSANPDGYPLKVAIGNTDLPCKVSNGVLYVQAPLPLLFEAFAEDVSSFVRDMEVRVSTEGGATLPLDRNGYPVLSETMADESVDRDYGLPF